MDVHSDEHHNRSVLTLSGTTAPREVARAAVSRLDLGDHDGVHPRIGVIDVVPFVPLGEATMADALETSDAAKQAQIAPLFKAANVIMKELSDMK